MKLPDLFTRTLNLLQNGKFAEEVSEELAGVINAVSDTMKKGQITVTIDVLPDANGRYRLVQNVKTKKPQGPSYATILWGTPEGNLQKTDPSQTELELREVSEKQDIRSVEKQISAIIKTV